MKQAERERETRHETRGKKKTLYERARSLPRTKNKTQNLFFVLRLYDNDNNNNDKKEREREKCP